MTLELFCAYRGTSGGNRTFEVCVEGTLIAKETIPHGEHVSRSYPLPAALVHGREKVTVRFHAEAGLVAGDVMGVRVLRSAPPNP